MTVSAAHQHSFPDDPILVALIHAARYAIDPSETIIYDGYGYDKSFSDLFGDIVQMRQALIAQLPASSFGARGLLREERPYIATLTRSGYEFLVAFFSIRSIGGACVPFGSGVLPVEAQQLIHKTEATALLFDSICTDSATKIAAHLKQYDPTGTPLIPISINAQPLNIANFEIDTSFHLDPQKPGVVVLTSGSTGLPKGAVLPRLCMYLGADTLSKPGSCAINVRPPNWIGGLASLVLPIVTGKKLHSTREAPSAEEIWDVFLNNEITDCGFAPLILRMMKEHITDPKRPLSPEEYARHIDSFKHLSAIQSGGAMLPQSIVRFWTEATGLPFQNLYASTESGGLGFWVNPHSKVQNSIGTPLPGYLVKLSEGGRGELLIKFPAMLTHYVGDEERTQAVFDEEGYYRTGDLVELVDGEYVFLGRADSEHILFQSFQISTIRVENGLMDLPYISEACVLGVPFPDAKSLCAAIIRTKPLDKDSVDDGQPISLARIRSDLSRRGGKGQDGLPTSMQPVLLRVLTDEENIPLTVSGKPIKREVCRRFFTETGLWSEEDATPGVESWWARL